MRLRFDFPSLDGDTATASALHFTQPRRVIEARTTAEVLPALREVEQAALAGDWVAGFIGYEAAPGVDPALSAHPPTGQRLLWFGVFAHPAPAPAGSSAGAIRRPLSHQEGRWEPRLSDADYSRGFAAVKAAIAEGHTYQTNYTLRLERDWSQVDPWQRYETLLDAHRPPYAACLDLGDVVVLSLSPELLLERRGRQVTSAPMKGTARRGRWAEEDAAQARALSASAKDRAENVMIVDLVRNDLGRVCDIGTVTVTGLFDVQRYRAAWQMVSTVTGRLRDEVTLTDALTALFPAGSITGAPKSSTTRLIRAIEPEPRGVYCGSIGLVAPGGDALFNVAIRTAVVERASGRVTLGVGGGITWDSAPAAELAEARLKAAFLDVPPEFALLETMRFDGTAVTRWPRHLARLRASAAFLERPLDDTQVTAAVDAHLTPFHGQTRRVRLTVRADGAPLVTSTPLGPPPSGVRVAVAADPVSSADVFLCHKTTARDVYDARRASRPDVFDVVLTNEHGELTECTIGNLVLDLDGRLVTPPATAGLLPGVFRAELLAEGRIHEQSLRAADLARAREVWLVNSVREWVAATVVP